MLCCATSTSWEHSLCHWFLFAAGARAATAVGAVGGAVGDAVGGGAAAAAAAGAGASVVVIVVVVVVAVVVGVCVGVVSSSMPAFCWMTLHRSSCET